jgi:hypothetical protein
MSEKLKKLYDELNETSNRDLLSEIVPNIITRIDDFSRSLLSKWKTVELESEVLGKQYFAFKKGSVLSRPVNSALFNIDLPKKHIAAYIANDFSGLSKEEVAVLLYTLVMAFSAATDILKPGNRKSPATYFEKFVGSMFARAFNVQPTNVLTMLNDESLPTDYVYKTSKGKADLHLQMKLSTRERAIEAWAHQRIIDGLFGVDTYKGILVIMAETNRRAMSVTEVCVPRQWGIYQKHIAKLHRIYYLDIPVRTANLHMEEPYIQVKHLSELLFEKDRILAPSSH